MNKYEQDVINTAIKWYKMDKKLGPVRWSKDCDCEECNLSKAVRKLISKVNV